MKAVIEVNMFSIKITLSIYTVLSLLKEHFNNLVPTDRNDSFINKSKATGNKRYQSSKSWDLLRFINGKQGVQMS